MCCGVRARACSSSLVYVSRRRVLLSLDSFFLPSCSQSVEVLLLPASLFGHLSIGQATHRQSRLHTSAPVPILAVRPPHACHGQETGLSPWARTCSNTWSFLWRFHFLADFICWRIACLTHFSHDRHRAKQRHKHKHKQSRNSRAGALMAHHRAYMGPRVGPMSPRQNCPNMVAERQCWLLLSESVQPACATVVCAGYARSANKSTFETHCEANENFVPSKCAEMLTIAVCTHADRAERTSMVSICTVVIPEHDGAYFEQVTCLR